MNEPGPDDPLHGLDEGDEDPRESARRQIAFLAEGLDPSASGAAAAALLDEAYRAAHLLRSSLDPASAPNTVRVARQVQALVAATRKGVIPPGPAVMSLLRTAADAVRDSLESVLRGKREDAAAGEAANALEGFLGSAFAAAPVVADAPGPARYVRVTAGKLDVARAAARAAAAAVTSFSRAREAATAAERSLRAQSERRARLASEVMAALPEGLAAAARGEPVTGIAQDLAGRVAALAALEAEGEDSIARLTAKTREAGEAGAHAMEAGAEALDGLAGVSVRHVLFGLEGAARSAATRHHGGPVDVHVELGDGEVESSLGSFLRTATLQAVRSLVIPERGRARGRRTAPPLSLSIGSLSTDGMESIRISATGNALGAAELSSRLSSTTDRLARRRGSLRVERRRADRISVILNVPAFRRPRGQDESFLLVMVRDILEAIPSASVVECIPAPAPGSGRGGKGTTPPMIALGDASAARAGVVVRAGKGSAVLLVDSIAGEESLRLAAPGNVEGDARAAMRAEGTAVSVVDVPGLVAAARAAARSRPAKTAKAVSAGKPRAAVRARSARERRRRS